MKVLNLLTVAGMATGLATSVPAYAQGGVLLRPATVEAEVTSAPPNLDERTVKRRMGNAEWAVEQGNMRGAERMYASLAEDLVSIGSLPTEALWRLATVTYSSGRVLEAAVILDRLAELAERHGAVEIQALSLLEAARMYEAKGKIAESVDRLGRGVSLLATPGIPADARLTLLRRVRA